MQDEALQGQHHQTGYNLPVLLIQREHRVLHNRRSLRPPRRFRLHQPLWPFHKGSRDEEGRDREKSEPELIQFSHKNLGRQPRQGFPAGAVNICLPEVSTKRPGTFFLLPVFFLWMRDTCRSYLCVLSITSHLFYNSSWLTPSSTIWPPGKSAPPQPSTRFVPAA